MDTPTTDLPQPPRDPYPTMPEEAFEVPMPTIEQAHAVQDAVAAMNEPQEAAEAPQDARPTASDSPAKLGITAVRQLDERVGVMIDRINAFRIFAAKHGVDQQTNSPSLIKRQIVEALVSLSAAEGHLAAARVNTTTARETLESL